MKISSIFILLLICLLGFFLRFYQLTQVPSGFFSDEASIGYNAYTILTQGEDEYGTPFPLFFRSLNDYKGPTVIYITVPFIALFGLNEFAIRLPSVFFGIGTIIILYLIGLTVSKKLGLWASFIGAIMPWLIHYDRVAFLVNAYAFFFVATIYCLIKSTTQIKYIFPASFLAVITLYTYQPPKLLIPLLLIGFFIIYKKTILRHKKKYLQALGLFLILSVPIGIHILVGDGMERFNQVSIFQKNLPFQEIILKITSNYFLQFHPFYFFKTGEPTFITRHFNQGLLPLLISFIPFLLLGFIQIIKTIKTPFSLFLFFWLAIYPLGGTFVSDGPYTSRSVIGAPLTALIIALGIVYSQEKINQIFKNQHINILYIVGIITAFLLNTLFFYRFYITQYPLYSSDFWGWQYGAKQIVTYFDESSLMYDELIMNPEFNGPEIFIKFYAPNGCNNCSIGFPHEKFDASKKQLFAVTPSYIKTHKEFSYKLKHAIFLPNKKIAFYITEIVQ